MWLNLSIQVYDGKITLMADFSIRNSQYAVRYRFCVGTIIPYRQTCIATSSVLLKNVVLLKLPGVSGNGHNDRY